MPQIPQTIILLRTNYCKWCIWVLVSAAPDCNLSTFSSFFPTQINVFFSFCCCFEQGQVTPHPHHHGETRPSQKEKNQNTIKSALLSAHRNQYPTRTNVNTTHWLPALPASFSQPGWTRYYLETHVQQQPQGDDGAGAHSWHLQSWGEILPQAPQLNLAHKCTLLKSEFSGSPKSVSSEELKNKPKLIELLLPFFEPCSDLLFEGRDAFLKIYLNALFLSLS